MKPYVAYKDSGIEWIGKIPAHWGIRKLKQLGIFTSSGIDKKIAEGEVIVKMINYTNIYGNKSCILNNNSEYMTVSCSEEKKRTHNIIKGDIVFTPSSETTEDIGLSALVNEDIQNTVYSYHVIRLRFSEKVNHGYKKYLCNNHFVLNQFSKCAKGTTRQILGRNDFKNIQVLIPLESEQKIIADFLDKKIDIIDSIISKKEKMIELLKEERTAVINEAVTKGLNPDNEMKDSGIERIGKIPKEWKVNRLKMICTFIYGDSLTNEDRISGNIPVYGSNGIVGYHDKAITHKPCIIVGRKGSYGKINFSDTECFPIDTTYFIDDRSAKCDLKWLNYALPLLELDKFSNDTGVPGLNREYVHNKRIPTPEQWLQKSIAAFLDRETAKIDTLIAKQERLIEALKEYRTALISEVVTGKIDVREYAV